MTPSEQPPDRQHETPSEEEQRLLDLLDRYIAALHSGHGQSRSEILEHHPELHELFGCLDRLERLAPPASPAPEPGIAETVDAETSPSTERSVADPEQPHPGRLGKYEIEEELGRGAMGVVFKARQQDLDRPVALKVLLSSRLASRDVVRRFYAEARAAGSIRHPHVVGIHEAGEADGQHYIAMDFVDGPSLAHVLREGPVDAERAARCVAQVARAVDHLHAHNIVHRDLKPSNILLESGGETPCVTDFGLAKIFGGDSEHTQSGTIIGTPAYMSPEQAAGRTSDISPRSDVYSLGAILYEMVTGRPVFQEQTPLDTLVQVLEGEPTLLSKVNPAVPRELELICLKCLEKEPGNRYESAAALADDLERFLKGEPIAARPSGLLQRLHRWGRREPALVSRLGGLLAAAGIVEGHFQLLGGEAVFHAKVMAIFGLWAVVAFVFQRLLGRDRWADVTRLGWAASDVILLTLMLTIAEKPHGPLLIGYPLLVAAAGLFFRVRLVLFTTLVSLVSYSALVMVRNEEAVPTPYPLIFAAVLAVLGFVVAYQVHRMRVLSRYYERRG